MDSLPTHVARFPKFQHLEKWNRIAIVSYPPLRLLGMFFMLEKREMKRSITGVSGCCPRTTLSSASFFLSLALTHRSLWPRSKLGYASTVAPLRRSSYRSPTVHKIAVARSFSLLHTRSLFLCLVHAIFSQQDQEKESKRVSHVPCRCWYYYEAWLSNLAIEVPPRRKRYQLLYGAKHLRHFLPFLLADVPLECIRLASRYVTSLENRLHFPSCFSLLDLSCLSACVAHFTSLWYQEVLEIARIFRFYCKFHFPSSIRKIVGCSFGL